MPRRLLRIAALAAPLLLAADPRIMVQGHRGARARFPENTMPAFEYALEQGVDAIELDMAVTKDNVIVVSHDPILRPPVCSGPRPQALIHDLTLSEVRQWDCGAVRNPAFPEQQPVPGTKMPTLDQVFELARRRGDFEFNIETKIFADHPEYAPPPEEFARLVLARIRAHRLEQRVMVQSFDFRTLTAMRKLEPQIRLSALVDKDQRDFTDISKAAADAEIVSPEWRLVTGDKVAGAHALGLLVIPWTANTPAAWDALIAAEVDAIITDDPARLIAYLRGKNRR